MLSARVQPYKTVCPIPVGILHSQGCPTQHLPQGACAGLPPHGEEHLQPFVPTLTAGWSVPEGARADGRDGEGGRSRRGQRLGPRPALGGGSAPQHGGGAPGAAPARPHGPGTRAGPALPPPRPPGKEPPLLRDLLAELRPRPLAWGAAGSSRPAGGVRRIPGRGGGERRECREYESGPGAAVRPGPARLPRPLPLRPSAAYEQRLRPPCRAPCPPTPRGAEWPRCRRGAPSGGTAGPCSPARAAPGEAGGTQRRGSAGPSLSPGRPQDGACLRGARGCGTGVCRHVLQSPRGTNRGLQPRLKPFGGVFGDDVRSKPVMHYVGRPARLCVLALMGAFFFHFNFLERR